MPPKSMDPWLFGNFSHPAEPPQPWGQGHFQQAFPFISQQGPRTKGKTLLGCLYPSAAAQKAKPRLCWAEGLGFGASLHAGGGRVVPLTQDSGAKPAAAGRMVRGKYLPGVPQAAAAAFLPSCTALPWE